MAINQGARLDNASEHLKEDVWQVLAHALANNLIWIALALVVGGTVLAVFLPKTRFGRDIAVAGAIAVIVAVIVHGLGWSQLL
jgi:hypothetical protein